MNITSIPVAAHDELFRWQLELFWFCHRQIYGHKAASKAHAIVINCNHPNAPRISEMPWSIDIPHTICRSVYDDSSFGELPPTLHRLAVPLNIQLGLMQVLPSFDDSQIIELTDCDMFHFRPCPVDELSYDELHVSTIYEDWHLFSLSTNRHIIEPYFENGGKYYNGGFVPIIGRAATFKRILPEWIAIHLDILKRPYSEHHHWWAGMFALQAACEKAAVQMIAQDYCYVPSINPLSGNHYCGHYSVDRRFDKRTYPAINRDTFEQNPFYDLIAAWMDDDGNAGQGRTQRATVK